MCCNKILFQNYAENSETKIEVRTFQEMKKKDEAIGEMDCDASQRKENKLLMKGVTHSGSSMLLVFCHCNQH